MAGPWLLPQNLQRLWFVHAMTRNKALLNIGADVVLEGAFSPEELREAFAAAIGRHDAFRVRFRLGTMGPECESLDKPILRWQVRSLEAFPDPTAERVHAQVAQVESEPFPVEEGALVRGTVYILAPGRGILAITAHHLVADAWTLRVLVEDVLREWRRRCGEVVPVAAPPGSLLASLVTSCNPTTRSNSERFSHQTTGLPPDRVVGSDDRSGKGAEVAIRIEDSLCRHLRRSSATAGQTFFVMLIGAFFCLLRNMCRTPIVEVGVLLTTRDLRHQRNTAGCFVQAAPLAIEVATQPAPSGVVREAGRQMRGLLRSVRRGQPLPAGRLPIMMSMVRDSSVSLIAPVGIGVRYERRRRTQAECDLQVFFYERDEGIEAVFNYDSDILDSDTVAAWGNSYLRVLEHLCETPSGFLEEPAAIACRLQHVGLAAWEVDIGVRRLATAGYPLEGRPIEDFVRGVAMALAGSPEGLQWEVIAPLREDAPCVGALMRDGEGPYHCCWRVASVGLVLSAMRWARADYTVVRRGETSGLFPAETIAFVVVGGFGLVELMEGIPLPGATASREPGALPGPRLYVASDDIANARRFLRLMGYRPQGLAGTDPVESWTGPDPAHEICLVRVKEGEPSRISRVVSLHQANAATGDALEDSILASSEMSTRWWSRCQLGVDRPC